MKQLLQVICFLGFLFQYAIKADEYIQSTNHEISVTDIESALRLMSESIGNESFEDSEDNIEYASQLAMASIGKNDIIEANAHYMWSVILRRSPLFMHKYVLKARLAIGHALALVPHHQVVNWHQEYGSFLSVTNGVSDSEETMSSVNRSTFISMMMSFQLSSSKSIGSPAEITNNVEVLIDLSGRFASVQGKERALNTKAARAALGLALHIAGSELPGSKVHLEVLRAVLHRHKNLAGRHFQKLVKSNSTTTELLWVAFAQLKSGYASTEESKRAVSAFTSYTHQALTVAERSHSEHVDLLHALPIIPHWDLGFSGPTGIELASSLMSWNKVIKKLLSGPRRDIQPPVTESLTVGFVSSWFCNSAVGRLMLGLIQHMDREKFSVVLYHLIGLSGKLNEDSFMTESFRQGCDRYLVVDMRLGLAEAQVSLLSLSPDVLVYTDLGMEPSSYYLASHRLASLQIVFWGHPFTSGLVDSVDYYLLPRGAEYDAGGDTDNMDSQERYSEQLVRFDSLGSYYPIVDNVEGEVEWFNSFDVRLSTLGSLAASKTISFMDGSTIPPNHGVFQAPLYASIQHCGKFHPLFDATLLKILAADPLGVLLLRNCETSRVDLTVGFEQFTSLVGQEERWSFRARLGELSEAFSERVIVLQDQVSLGTLMRLVGAAHVALEPFPFPASITSLDAFMAGTPVVAHGGSLSTHGIAQLSAMLYRVGSSTCCIARTDNHFVSLAIDLANNQTSRIKARQELLDLKPFLFDNRDSLEEWSRFLSLATSNHQFEQKSLQPAHRILSGLRQLDWLQSAYEATELAMELLRCGKDMSSHPWGSNISETPYFLACETLGSARSMSNRKGESAIDRLALAHIMQDISGCLLWIYTNFELEESFIKKTQDNLPRGWWNQTIDEVIDHILANSPGPQAQSEFLTEAHIDTLAALSALFAHCCLILDDRLITAAAFGAGSLTRIHAFDLAAELYTIAAHLKRPYFGNITNESIPDWQALARMDPFDVASKGDEGALMQHPSTAFDLGAEDGDELSRRWRPFRRIQFGGYNSAYLRHLSNQLRHLTDLHLIPHYFLAAISEIDELSQYLDDVLREGARHSISDIALPSDREHVELVEPHPTDNFPLAKTLALIGRTVYLRPTPALPSGALAPSLMQREDKRAAMTEKEIDAFYSDGFAVIDGLLSERALREVREFCQQSTVFHKNYIQGYVGSFLGDGFGTAGLVHQIASELKQAFPGILENKRLVQAWAYKYDEEHERGIDPHSDAGQVSVNLWVSEDDSNLDPATGGLLIWPELPPEEWSFGKSNFDTAAIKSHLNEAKQLEREPLELDHFYDSKDKGKRSVRIPFKENRCLIFRSRLFHQTDNIHFKTGYKNRRINLTFLFQ